jgi:hypothetical protein
LVIVVLSVVGIVMGIVHGKLIGEPHELKGFPGPVIISKLIPYDRMLVVLRLAVVLLFLLSLDAYAQSPQMGDLAVSPIELPIIVSSELQDSIQDELYSSYATLKDKYDSTENHVVTVTQKLDSQADSLRQMGLPSTHVQRKLDSLRSRAEVEKAQLHGKLDSLKRQTADRLSQLNLPPEIKDHGALKDIQSLDLSLPKVLDVPGPQLDLGNIKIDLDELPPTSDLLDGHLPDMLDLKPGTIGSELGSVKGLTAGTDGLEHLAENQLQDVAGLNSGLPLDQIAAPIPTSEEDAKKEVVKQAKKVAVDHFKGKDKELKSAMDLVSKYKKGYASFNSLAEISGKRPNEMRGKPLIERMIPGIALQLHKHDDELAVDFNPYVGYRFTGHITGGVGWNQRLSYDFDANNFNDDARVFGPRIYGEYVFSSGFSPRVELEVMNTYVPPFARTISADDRTRQWVPAVFVGIKREFKFLKKVKGTAQVMARLFDIDHKSPYPDVVNARFGFEFPLKRSNAKEN